ncbi:uncharacterized protein LTR77_010262 [Saxophila tyrrhenica]|uniref:Glycosyl transferase 64 domain-containing protein n=1 Tax=Saxophila tyrrhenica TaxID=1690608 RepID=A0AAV9NXA7_9PEZI|nr:hypothetical protein LTR77_010262 [Saxophila tyrrhenica]
MLGRRAWTYATASFIGLALIYIIFINDAVNLPGSRTQTSRPITQSTPLNRTREDDLERVLGPLRHIVSPTYHRTEALPEYLDNYATGKIPSLRKIILIWNNEEDAPASLNRSIAKYPVPVVLERRARNSKNERFRRTPAITTAAVLALDDDMVIIPRDVEYGFQAWQTHRYPRSRMVGYVRRRVSADGHYRMSPSPQGYSMVLTKSAFIHVDWMDLWWADTLLMQDFRDYVDARKLPEKYPDLRTGCEDIAMSYLYAHHTRMPPLWVADATFHDIGHAKMDGISTQPGHNDARQACVHHFNDVFGKDTMVDTQMHVTLIKDDKAADWV